MSNEFVGILTTKSMLETSVGEDKQAITRIIPASHVAMLKESNFMKFVRYVVDDSDYVFDADEVDVRNEILGYLNELDSKNKGKLRVWAYDGESEISNISDSQSNVLSLDDSVLPYIRTREVEGTAFDCLDIVVKYWSKVGV
ncbi:hypothetical protein HN587_04765 [Candidatus Woesearchaeota archaeon]|jgi:hypothetical protein|nr:hypothetical protein [Candidatus Woesearchaeota archaeon]